MPAGVESPTRRPSSANGARPSSCNSRRIRQSTSSRGRSTSRSEERCPFFLTSCSKTAPFAERFSFILASTPHMVVVAEVTMMSVIELELALERAKELRAEGGAFRKHDKPLAPRGAGSGVLPRAAALRLGTTLVGLGERLVL